jgi:hypothetical protein
MAPSGPGPFIVPVPPGEEPGALEVETWRIVTLFLVILAIDFLWSFLDKVTTNKLRGSGTETGLLHAWEHLKFEICALGIVSLLLAVFQVRPLIA